ncbi:MAG: hypothetical protein QOJ46_477 [bacterium]|jgi:hypothetical protein
MAGNVVPPYGVAIHQARESGDLDKMRKAAADAEAHLAEHGDVAGALQALKAEIARLEARGKG